MRNLIRTPLTWLVIAELLVVGVLIVLAWQLVASAVRPASAASSVPAVAPAADTGSSADSPLPDLPAIGKPPAGPMPGLNLDSEFWRARLAQLNQDQVFFERLEWQVVHTAIASMERYIQVVVVPAIQRAERGGGGRGSVVPG